MSKKVDILTTAQAAEILNLPEHTFRARLRNKRLKSFNFKRSGKRYVIFRDELFERQLEIEKKIPRRSPKLVQEEIIVRLDQLERKFSELVKGVEEIKSSLRKEKNSR